MMNVLRIGGMRGGDGRSDECLDEGPEMSCTC